MTDIRVKLEVLRTEEIIVPLDLDSLREWWECDGDVKFDIDDVTSDDLREYLYSGDPTQELAGELGGDVIDLRIEEASIV